MAVLALDPFSTLREDLRAAATVYPETVMRSCVRQRVLEMASFNESLAHSDVPVFISGATTDTAKWCTMCLLSYRLGIRQRCVHYASLSNPEHDVPYYVQRVYLSPDPYRVLRHACHSAYTNVQQLALLPSGFQRWEYALPFPETEFARLLSLLPSLQRLALGCVNDASVIVQNCTHLRSLFVQSTLTLHQSMPRLTRFSCVHALAHDLDAWINCDAAAAMRRNGAALEGCRSLTAVRLRSHYVDHVSTNHVLQDAVLKLPRLRFLAFETLRDDGYHGSDDSVEDTRPLTLHISIFTNKWGSIRTQADGVTRVECRGSAWLHLRAMIHDEDAPRATLLLARAETDPSTALALWVLLHAPTWLFKRVTTQLLQPLFADLPLRRFNPETLHCS